MTKLVEISSIEFPPQLVDHEAQHMLETITRNVERQGLQLPQYLRLVGKEQDAFEAELREQAESNVRRSLILDAFADAEKIDVAQQEIEEEVRRAVAGSADAETVERLALQNPNTMQRAQEATRARKASERLVELATGNDLTKSSEKKTRSSETSDTQKQSRKSSPRAAAESAEDGGTA